ncbi:MAG: ArsR/SmtB family transcription factor [Maritimibacter sp.]
MIDDETISRQFRALAHPCRARVFRMLLDAPELGESAQTLGAAVKMPASTLARHLREMEAAGVVHRRRNGARVAIYLTPESLVALMTHVSYAVETKAYQLDAA